MKIFVAALLFIVMALMDKSAQAQDYRMALGARISSGGPAVNNSITFRYFLNDQAALEGMASFDPGAIGLLYEVFRPVNNLEGFKWFFGAGAYGGFGNGQYLGAQGIIGLDYKFNNVPINLSVDWKPELNLVNEVMFEPSALGLSVRFTFH
jgi:hypothetical protein